MVLTAWEHGVGSCWVSRFEVRALGELLNLPKNILPAEILVFGYPESPQKTAPKKSLAEVVFYGKPMRTKNHLENDHFEVKIK